MKGSDDRGQQVDERVNGDEQHVHRQKLDQRVRAHRGEQMGGPLGPVKNALTVTWGNAPETRPNRLSVKAIRRPVNPARFISSAVTMKYGIAIKTNLAIPA